MNKKKLLALLMALVMTLTLVPVTALAEGGNVAKIGDAEYASLADAIDAVPDGTATTIEMIADSAEPEVITIAAGKNITLDLAGHEISYTENASGKSVYFLTNKGELTIQDTSTNGNGNIVFTATPKSTSYSYETVTIYNLGGTLNFASGKITNASDGGLAYAVNNSSNAWGSDVISTFNMTGGTISAPNGDAALRVYQNCAIGSVLSKNYVNISGGTIYDTGIFVDTYLYTTGKDATNYEGNNIETIVNIEGGTINGLVDLKIRHPFHTSLNISGGNFSDSKLWVRKVASEYATAGSITEPAAPMVNISGGKWSFVDGKAFGLAYDCGATSWTSYTQPYYVTGGVFNVDLNNYAGIEFAAGMTGIANTDADTMTAYPYTVGVNAPTAVAQIGTTKFETLKAAAAAVADDQTIVMLNDVTEEDEVVFDHNNAAFTLDLAGHTVTVNNDIWAKNGHLTLTSSVAGGKVADGQNGAAIYVSSNYNNAQGTLTIDSDNVTVEGGQWGIAFMSNSVVNINAGTVKAVSTVEDKDSYGISGNGNSTGAQVNIYGGKVTGNTLGVYFPGSNALNISGGTISGEVGVYVKSGTTTITGGTINGTGDKRDYSYYSNGGRSTGDAVVIDNCNYPSGAPSASIKNATLNSANGSQVGYYVYGSSTEGTVKADKRYTLSTNVPTKGWVANDEVQYPVKIGTPEAVAKIGDEEYATLVGAIEAANENGGTITLLRDYDMEANEPGYGWTTLAHSARENFLVISGNVTLNLDGHTLSNLFNNTFKITGNVTVQNGEMRVGQYTNGASCSYVMMTDAGANLTVNNVTTYGGINVAGGSTATINDLAFSGTLFYAVCSQENSTVTINGGTFNKAIAGSTRKLFWIEDGSTMNITGGNFNIEGNSDNFLNGSVKPVITGGKFDFDPTNKGVAPGYEAVALTGENTGKWQVGKVKATELHETNSTEGTKTFTASKNVVDKNNTIIPSDSNTTFTVTVIEGTKDPSGTTDTVSLNNVKMEEVVALAVDKANEGNTNNAAEVSAYVTVQLAKTPTAAEETKATFEVHPEAVITVGETETKVPLTNDQIKGSFSFALDVDDVFPNSTDFVVVHVHEDGTKENLGVFTKDSDGEITLSNIKQFSDFEVSPLVLSNDDSENLYFEGGSLRRRVKTIDGVLTDEVIRGFTDFRFGYQIIGYDASNQEVSYYFQWSKDGVNWSKAIPATHIDEDGHVSLVITSVPQSWYGNNLYSRLCIVDADGNVTMSATNERTVDEVADYYIDYHTQFELRWVNYAKLLRGGNGVESYYVVRDAQTNAIIGHKLNSSDEMISDGTMSE